MTKRVSTTTLGYRFAKKYIMPDKVPYILLVDDNMHDAEMTIRALKKCNVTNPVIHLINGVFALDFLLCRGEYADRDITDTPALVLLDLKMPKVDGWEVMAKLHETGEVNKMPVVVLTASKDHPDSGKCLEMGARALIAKPVTIDGFVTCMEEIKMYWIIEKDPDEQY